MTDRTYRLTDRVGDIERPGDGMTDSQTDKQNLKTDR